MDILLQIKAPLLVQIGVLETLGTVFLCYALAVVNGHVPEWLPMISDCAVYPPEKYPFRLGLLVAAMFIVLETVFVYSANVETLKNRSCLAAGVIASITLAIVSVVNEQENDSIHSGTSIIKDSCHLYNLVEISILNNNIINEPMVVVCQFPTFAN